LAELPVPLRWAVLGAATLGLLGCAVGLTLGLNAYAPTAWAATFEVAIPAAALGLLLGFIGGSARLLASRQKD
jgi:hypothetical protein